MGNLIYPRFLVAEIYAIELVVCEELRKMLCDLYVMYSVVYRYDLPLYILHIYYSKYIQN